MPAEALSSFIADEPEESEKVGESAHFVTIVSTIALPSFRKLNSLLTLFGGVDVNFTSLMEKE
jgi:hypothetical protein